MSMRRLFDIKHSLANNLVQTQSTDLYLAYAKGVVNSLISGTQSKDVSHFAALSKMVVEAYQSPALSASIDPSRVSVQVVDATLATSMAAAIADGCKNRVNEALSGAKQSNFFGGGSTGTGADEVIATYKEVEGVSNR